MNRDRARFLEIAAQALKKAKKDLGAIDLSTEKDVITPAAEQVDLNVPEAVVDPDALNIVDASPEEGGTHEKDPLANVGKHDISSLKEEPNIDPLAERGQWETTKATEQVENIFENITPEPETLGENELNLNFQRAYTEIASLQRNYSYSDPNRYLEDVDDILNQQGISLDWDNEKELEEFKQQLSVKSLSRFDIINRNVKYYKTLAEKKAKTENLFSPEVGGLPKEQTEAKTGVGEGTVRVEKQAESDTKQRLEAARKEYIKAKEELDKLSLLDKVGIIVNVKTFFGSKVKEETGKVKQAFAEKEAEFKRIRAEYLAENIDGFLEEKEEQLKLQVDERDKKTSLLSTAATAVYEGYKNLGSKYNLEKFLEKSERGKKVLSRFDRVSLKVAGKEFKVGRAAVRAVNLRTVTSLGLLGAGVGFGAGSAVGISAIIGRRWMSGAGTGVGLYDLGNALAARKERNQIEKILDGYKNKDKKANLGDLLASLEAGGLMAGKFVDEIQSDPLYKEIVDLMKEKQNPVLFEKFLNRTEESVDFEIRRRKWLRSIGKLAATSAGLFVGSGMLADLVGSKAKHLATPNQGIEDATNVTVEPVKPIETPMEVPKPESVATPSPEVPNHEVETPKTENPSVVDTAPPAKTTPDLSTNEVEISQAETPGESVNLTVGKRGIEGAMLDLRKTNPGQYKKMLAWMKEQVYDNADGKEILVGTAKNGQAITDEGVIIHRYMLKYAHENGYSLGDGGISDLVNYKDLGITVESDGSIEIYTISPEPEDVVSENMQTSVKTPVPKEVTSGIENNSVQEKLPNASGAEQSAPRAESTGLKVESFELEHGEPVPESTTRSVSVTETASQIYETDQISSLKDIPAEKISSYFTGFPKNSDALRSILGDSELNSLYKELNLSPEKLNELKDLPMVKFTSQVYEKTGDIAENNFGRDYGALANLMNSAHESLSRVPEITTDNLDKLSVRDFLIKYAIERRLSKNY